MARTGHSVPQIGHSGRVRVRERVGGATLESMWDTVETSSVHLSHDLPCTGCGHGRHTYLPCSDTCDCVHGRDRTLSNA